MKFLILISFCIIFTYCTNNNPKVAYFSVDKVQGAQTTNLIEEETAKIDDRVAQAINQINISSVIDFNPDEITNITLTPKTFIQLTILFTQGQFSNIKSLTSPSNVYSEEEKNDRINQYRNDFYSNYRLTENDYIQYGIEYSEDIQEFLTNNPEFSEAYDLTQLVSTDH